MINSYNLLCEIEGKAEFTSKTNDINLKIGFLLTGNDYTKTSNNNNISKKANDPAIRQILNVKEIVKGVPVSDEDKKLLLWGWKENYEDVVFSDCFSSVIKN